MRYEVSNSKGRIGMRERKQVAIQSICLGVAVLLAVGFRPPEARAQTGTEDTSIYVLEPGETLYSVAFRFGMNVDSLAAMNGIDAGFLEAGDSLFIPTERTSRPYRVRRGDTLFALSKKFSVSVDDLRRTNGLRGSDLAVGQILMIPAEGAPDMAEVETLTATRGIAAVFATALEGRIAASGEAFRSNRYAISHPGYSVGSIVLVSSPDTARRTFAEVVETSLTDKPTIIDISAAVAKHLRLKSEYGSVIEIRLVDGTH